MAVRIDARARAGAAWRRGGGRVCVRQRDAVRPAADAWARCAARAAQLYCAPLAARRLGRCAAAPHYSCRALASGGVRVAARRNNSIACVPLLIARRPTRSCAQHTRTTCASCTSSTTLPISWSVQRLLRHCADSQARARQLNATHRAEWVRATVADLAVGGADGLNLDFESPLALNDAAARAALTRLAADLRKAMPSNSQVSFSFSFGIVFFSFFFFRIIIIF